MWHPLCAGTLIPEQIPAESISSALYLAKKLCAGEKTSRQQGETLTGFTGLSLAPEGVRLVPTMPPAQTSASLLCERRENLVLGFFFHVHYIRHETARKTV